MRRIVAILLIPLMLGCGVVLGSENIDPAARDVAPTTRPLLTVSAASPPILGRSAWADLQRDARWWQVRDQTGLAARDRQDSTASQLRVIRGESSSNPKILPLGDPRIYLLVTSAIVHHRPKEPFADDLPLPSPSAEHNE